MRYWAIKKWATFTTIKFIDLCNVESIDIHEDGEGTKYVINEESRLQNSLKLSKEEMIEALQEAITLIKNNGKL